MCFVQYILGYGGGLVGGDSIVVECELGPGTAGTMKGAFTNARVGDNERTSHGLVVVRSM